jgi:flagellar motor switch protein FliN/FliY
MNDTPLQSAAEDDWAAALAEQKTVESAVVDNAQPANIVPRLSPTGTGLPEGNNDLDLILDIPVALTVELGRTKIRSSTSFSWRRAR